MIRYEQAFLWGVNVLFQVKAQRKIVDYTYMQKVQVIKKLASDRVCVCEMSRGYK